MRGAGAQALTEPASAPQPSGANGSAPRHQVLATDVVLDSRSDGARILGRALPPIPNSDADRVLVMSLEGVVSPTAARFEHVLDARFVGADIVVIDAQHVLWVLRGEDAIELDRDVEAPLAVRGDDLVYARGDMPLFELARADVARGQVTVLTEGYAPAYSPAIGEDGSVVFVSTREGQPRLHRVSPGAGVEALPLTQRTPSSPRAPQLERGRLTFEDELGTATLDVASGQVVGEVTP